LVSKGSCTVERGMSKLAKTLSLGAIVATGLVVTPSSASGAITIGATLPNPDICSPDARTLVQSTSPGGQYAAPSDGVITSWSYQAVLPPAALKFKVARFLGGNQFMIVGEGGFEHPVANMLNTYPVRIPVQANDIIGVYAPNGGALCSPYGAFG